WRRHAMLPPPHPSLRVGSGEARFCSLSLHLRGPHRRSHCRVPATGSEWAKRLAERERRHVASVVALPISRVAAVDRVVLEAAGRLYAGGSWDGSGSTV